jgi:hypothetical protein
MRIDQELVNKTEKKLGEKLAVLSKLETRKGL